MEKSTNFETLGAHIRNLLSPYSTLVQMLDEIYNGEDDVTVNHIKNYLLTELNIDNLKDNLKNFIDVSKLSEVEKINWRDTDLYKATTDESQSSSTDDNNYYRENCKGFQETGKCFVDGRCKSYTENKMNNNSNYTSIEQSKKLFALGADVNVADMLYIDGEVRGLSVRKSLSLTISDIPAWSLGSLIKLMTRSGGDFKIDYTADILPNSYSVVWKYRDTKRVLHGKDLFTVVFDMVCLLLHEHLI